MSNTKSTQYDIVLSASANDINQFIESDYQVNIYTKHRATMERSIINRMVSNNFTELGKVKIVKEPYFENVEIGKLLGMFINEELAKSIVVSVDLVATERNLKERYGFSEVAIQPLMDILKTKLSAYRDKLVKSKGKGE